MKDEELRKLLQNSLGGRRAPEDAKARILAVLRPRPLAWAAAAVAAGLVLAVAGAILFAGRPSLPAPLLAALEDHARSEVMEHAVSADTPRKIAETILETIGRTVELPALRDAGFSQVKAHKCGVKGRAHVVYQNSWTKVSCFVYKADKIPVTGGERLADGSVEGYSFRHDRTSAVAVREGGIVKLWVADLYPEHLAAIAVDAEQKRYTLKTGVLSVADAASSRAVGAVLSNMPGVEDYKVEPERNSVLVKYDDRRVSADEMVAEFVLNDMDVSWSVPEEKK